MKKFFLSGVLLLYTASVHKYLQRRKTSVKTVPMHSPLLEDMFLSDEVIQNIRGRHRIWKGRY
jgi:hypothetical protein